MAGRNPSPTSTSSGVSGATAPLDTHAASRFSSTASPPMSTPPTSLGDEASVLSDAIKTDTPQDASEAAPSTPAPADTTATPTPSQTPTPSSAATPRSDGRRSVRQSRIAPPTYNVQILAGTAIHTPTKYLEKHHKNVLHGALEDALPKPNIVRAKSASSHRRRSVQDGADETAETTEITDPNDPNDPAEVQLATEAAQAAQRRKSSRVDLRKEALRNLSAAGEAVAQRSPDLLSSVKAKVQNALRGTFADTNPDRAPAKGKLAKAAAVPEDEPQYIKAKSKQWERQGLYVGQHREFDARLKESQNRARRQSKKQKENSALPLPMFAGERMLNGDFQRNFKLPFDVYNPLPRKVKVDGWVKLQKNRFIGDASALWKKDKQDSSSCYCEPEDGCGEACHNRIMAYECDDTNCKLTAEECGNRPFAQLKRRAKGNGYDYGVEVMETGDKGYGVRAMRSFDPHQIIVEYAGEIITQQECERRMKQVYKKDKCYYLMSFDNKMIIDATRGTIARFVNHSCEPNCEMIKWTVGGEPRMALFAGSRGILTGEELTYDYNFDPFSSKNIQKCRCGTRNCRGVLGPKPKHQPREEKASMASNLLAGTKRKLQEVFGSGSGNGPNSPKKPRVAYMANASLTKEQNALQEEKEAREKAEKDAIEQAAQKATREARALKRQTSTTSMTVSTTSQYTKVSESAIEPTKVSANAPIPRQSLASIESSHTTTSLKRTTAPRNSLAEDPKRRGSQRRASSPKAFKGLSGHGNAAVAALRGKRSLHSTKTPARSASPESDDNSPNITPASLRSASKKLVQTTSQTKLTQSKLQFKPLTLPSSSASKPSASKPSASKPLSTLADTFAVPDTDDEEDEEEEEDEDEEDEDVDMDDDDDDDFEYTTKRAKKGPQRGSRMGPEKTKGGRVYKRKHD